MWKMSHLIRNPEIVLIDGGIAQLPLKNLFKGALSGITKEENKERENSIDEFWKNDRETKKSSNVNYNMNIK